MKRIDDYTTKDWAKVACGAFAVVASVIGGCRSYDSVPQQSFGVRVTRGQVQPKLLEPGYYSKAPALDTIYSFSNNVIILETTAGNPRNTRDQNDFSVELRLHYQIKPNVGVLSFHLDELSDNNGQKLLTKQLSNSVDSVVGQLTSQEALSIPADILKNIVPQLEWRLKQNNIAVEIDTIELLSVQMGNGLRLPVQMRIKPGQNVEVMTGPSAIPVAPSVVTPR